jgi:hypothetical protein
LYKRLKFTDRKKEFDMNRLKKWIASALANLMIVMALAGLGCFEAAAKNRPRSTAFDKGYVTTQSRPSRAFVQGLYRDALGRHRQPNAAFLEGNADRPLIRGFRYPGTTRQSHLLPYMEQGNLYR